jgi:hypothetical protein
MRLRDRLMAPPSGRVELALLVLAAWVAFISIPLGLGGIGLGWDALNHHIYLGWFAERTRFDLDFLAASYQSFQYPYLYWPVYKLFQSGISGQWAGVILVSINILVVPAVWLIARVCVAELSWYGVAMRWLAVALAFLTGVVLSLFDSTGNDLLAAIPLGRAAPALADRAAADAALGALRRCLGRLQTQQRAARGPVAAAVGLSWAIVPATADERGDRINRGGRWSIGVLWLLGVADVGPLRQSRVPLL